MCQAYDGEARSVAMAERREIRDLWQRHKSGEVPLSDEELLELAVRKLMLNDAGF
jgi:hypothetical protein